MMEPSLKARAKTMSDEQSRKVRSVPPTVFDDIRDFSIHNGVFSFTPYVWRVVPGEMQPTWQALRPMSTPLKSVAPMASRALFFTTRHSFYGCLDLPPFHRAN